MRVIALLALLFGFLMQLLLDGQVFTHAVFGIVCGVAAVWCGLASARWQPQYRWEGRVMAALGFVLGLWCIFALPGAYGRQERFNNTNREIREKMDRQQQTPNKSLQPTRGDAPVCNLHLSPGVAEL